MLCLFSFTTASVDIMSGLSLSMFSRLYASISDVFNRIVRRIVRKNCIEELPLLHYVLDLSVVPDDAFKWLSQSMRPSVEIISLLIKKRLSWDKRMNIINKLLENSPYREISCIEIEKLLEGDRIYLSPYEKHYLFTLLTEEKSDDAFDRLHRRDKLYDCSKSFSVKNVYLNYSPTETLVEEAICDAARLADHRLLKNIITAATENDMQCRFNPEEDPDHKAVLSWVQENLIKGCSGDDRLGWSMGPDSARWPSTELKDYVKTLDCLYEIMF